MPIVDAAYSLEELAAGRVPDAVRLLVGAMDLDTLWSHQEVRPDLSEAAAALRILASGVPLELSAAGRSVCGRLAADIRLYLRSA